MKYSNAVVDALIKELDPKIQKYFESTKAVSSYGYDDFNELVRSILIEYDMSNSESYRLKYTAEIESRKKRRQNWLARIKENRRNYSFRDNHSYFNYIYLQLANRIGSEIILSKYGTVDIEKIIDQIMLECEKWKKKRDSLLIDFPNFPYIGKISITSVFKSDIFVSLVKIIQEDYSGNLQHVMFHAPTDMITAPLFSSSHRKAAVKLTADKQMVAELFRDEKYQIRFFDIPEEAKKEFNVSGITKIPVLDDVDMTIISFLINNSWFDLTSSSVLTPIQTCSLNQLCQAVYGSGNGGISSHQKESVRKRLLRLAYPISAVGEKGTLVAWAVLSTVSVHKANNDSGIVVVEYTLSPVLTRSLIEGRILSIPNMEMRELKTAAGRTLIVQLQLDRLMAGWNNQYVHKYKYARFCQIMLLTSKSMQKNMGTITGALDDIREHTKDSVIKGYKIKNGEIEVEFSPLTSDEQNALDSNDIHLISEKRGET